MRKLAPALFVVIAATLLHVRPASSQSYLTGDEARVIAMVNGTRAQRGLPALERVESLVALAREQSRRMASESRLFHNPALNAGLDALGLDWHWSGENVGVGPDVDAVQQAFLGSTHHHENIVRSNYTAIGVGVVAAKTPGYVYVTQVFAELGNAPGPNLPDPPTATPTPTDRPARTPPPPRPTPVATPTAPPPPPPVLVEGGVVAPLPQRVVAPVRPAAHSGLLPSLWKALTAALGL